MTTRREIVRAGAGLAAIIAAGKAPAAFVRSMLGLRGAMTMRDVPALTDFFDCGWYGAYNRGGRYFVDTQITGLIGSTTRIETVAYWDGNSSGSDFGVWNLLFCAQETDNSDDTIQVRRGGTSGVIVANRSDSESFSIPTSPTDIILDGSLFTVSNITKTSTASTVANVKSLLLGGSWGMLNNQNERFRRCWHGCIGRTKVYVSGMLIADMCPLADNSGFYDLQRKLILPKTDIKNM